MSKPAVRKPRSRSRSKAPSGWQQLIHSSWTKVLSIIVTLGAVAGVFWAADQHWVNFPFHNQTVDLVLQKSSAYAKQLDTDNEKKLTEFAATIKTIQRNAEIKSVQDKAIFLMKQEMSMREAMAKLSAAGKQINPDFKAKLTEVIDERQKAETELKDLMMRK